MPCDEPATCPYESAKMMDEWMALRQICIGHSGMNANMAPSLVQDL